MQCLQTLVYREVNSGPGQLTGCAWSMWSRRSPWS